MSLTDEAIDLAWPSWWTDEAEASPSAAAELRFALARRLGLDAGELLQNDEPVFVWKVGKFKNLRGAAAGKEGAIVSFCTSIARAAASGLLDPPVPVPSAAALRELLLRQSNVVSLKGLVAYCWTVGVPILCLKVFPLSAKNMHAMAVRVRDRHAILIAREVSYPAQAAFDIAHELGHIALGHVSEGSVLADFDDPLKATDESDPEEEDANHYALELLGGDSDLSVLPSVDKFLSRDLAAAAMQAATDLNIDAGTLVLSLGYRTNQWAKAMAALKHIYGAPSDVSNQLNLWALSELTRNDLSSENEEFLRGALGLVQ